MLKREPEDGQASLADPNFRGDVLDGFASRPRAIPARWLYDRRGSELFEAITGLAEYYPTRTETAILQRCGGDIARHIRPGYAVVEFGSGSSTKTPLLIEAIAPAAYVPIDISGDFLRDSTEALAERFPDIDMIPIEGDFMEAITLPNAIADLPKLGFFPGSTIGNLVPRTSVDLLRAMRDALGDGSLLLIGMDRVKSEEVLIPAYDDAAGVTATFNLNLLERINRELDGTIPLEAFRHRAIWNETLTRIEMHLEATRDVAFTIDGRAFTMLSGETIHTENSHKYGPRDARMLLLAGEWTPVAEWTDPDNLFALLLAEARPRRKAP